VPGDRGEVYERQDGVAVSLYDDLDAGKEWPAHLIKSAYRRLAAKHHPDKGGDVEKFKAIQKAYDILGDPEKRARYDESGETNEPNSIHHQAMHNLAGLVLSVVDEAQDITTTPVKNLMLKVVQMNVTQIEEEIEQRQNKIEKRNEAIKRFEMKNAGVENDNVISSLLQGDIKAMERAIEEARQNIEVLMEMTRILGDYEYKTEKQSIAYPKFEKPTVLFTGL
jgi:curved DNA-binding protein CbpA